MISHNKDLPKTANIEFRTVHKSYRGGIIYIYDYRHVSTLSEEIKRFSLLPIQNEFDARCFAIKSEHVDKFLDFIKFLKDQDNIVTISRNNLKTFLDHLAACNIIHKSKARNYFKSYEKTLTIDCNEFSPHRTFIKKLAKAKYFSTFHFDNSAIRELNEAIYCKPDDIILDNYIDLNVFFSKFNEINFCDIQENYKLYRQILIKNNSIKKITARSNEDITSYLVDYLNHTKSVETLDAGCPYKPAWYWAIHDEKLRLIANSLKVNTTVKSLILSHQYITSIGLNYLFNSILENSKSKLSHIDLKGCYDIKSNSNIISFLKNNPSITSFKLPYNCRDIKIEKLLNRNREVQKKQDFKEKSSTLLKIRNRNELFFKCVPKHIIFKIVEEAVDYPKDKVVKQQALSIF